jgi:cholesterol transport system auxiliary component
MTFRNPRFTARGLLSNAGLIGVIALTGCSVLKPSAPPHAYFYALQSTPAKLASPSARGHGLSLPTLIVNPPHAAPGFDGVRIIFVRADNQLEYFAHSEWVEPPARMLGPLLVGAIERTNTFGAVVLMPASASGELRLNTELVRLQHNFQTQPSRVQFAMRVHLIDERTRKVVQWREFQTDAVAASETPQGGVAAANVAIQRALTEVAEFLSNRSTGSP